MYNRSFGYIILYVRIRFSDIIFEDPVEDFGNSKGVSHVRVGVSRSRIFREFPWISEGGPNETMDTSYICLCVKI